MSAQSREVFVYAHLDSAAKTATVVSVHASWPEAHRAANEGTGAFRSALPVRMSASAERPLPGDVLPYELVTPGGAVAIAGKRSEQAYVLECNCGVDDDYTAEHFCEEHAGPAAEEAGHVADLDVSRAFGPFDVDVFCKVCGVPLVGAAAEG